MSICGYAGILGLVVPITLVAVVVGGAAGHLLRSQPLGAAASCLLAIGLNVALFTALYFTTPAHAPPEVREQSYSWCLQFGGCATTVSAVLATAVTVGLLVALKKPRGENPL
jgi:hypothetical protein